MRARTPPPLLGRMGEARARRYDRRNRKHLGINVAKIKLRCAQERVDRRMRFTEFGRAGEVGRRLDIGLHHRHAAAAHERIVPAIDADLLTGRYKTSFACSTLQSGLSNVEPLIE